MSVLTFSPESLAALGVRVTKLATDSRAVKSGDTFVACPGSRVDGRQFIGQAIANGANAVIWEAEGFDWNAEWRVPNLKVADLRDSLGELADQVYGQPSKQLWMVGVTGTNGKTSCSHWIAQTLNALGRKTALIGTLGNGFPDALQVSPNTTPDAVTLHGLLADYLVQGAQAVAMEVSSHALQQGRVNGVAYDVALLTNLSRDHLDYHGDMAQYALAKSKLFHRDGLGCAVLNFDDVFGVEIAGQLQDGGAEVIAYGLGDEALAEAERLGVRMVHGSHLRMSTSGLALEIHSSWGAAQLTSALLGRFNAENLLGALAVLLASGVQLADAVRELSQVRAAPGRMQTFGGNGRPAVVVDYAHTPDALEKVLRALRETMVDGRLICVFGCGGDRDRGKRPLMGRVASRLADAVIVTSDNPRGENPREIIAAVIAGMDEKNYRVIEDRAEAIFQAIAKASANDTVLVAGKGHEAWQEINGVKHPFSDADTVARTLAVWRAPT
ncbi:MAG: UDP-N-acetylmuramoyl-L-alanyl-D-glutamate--2,6-diaminopimelate ligase [Gallionellaceae bacterium]|jgi:UDP-N-acetylmuramoyl-L-alanyl-D-glutamate--2,6-diaminopimelate ligase|nr:UDP-N-acetylmuramoyl-L-alanyl-D-glutamate--2,6-diaminopimelate ligase [Gallionellaceae bacterium]